MGAICVLLPLCSQHNTPTWEVFCDYVVSLLLLGMSEDLFWHTPQDLENCPKYLSCSLAPTFRLTSLDSTGTSCTIEHFMCVHPIYEFIFFALMTCSDMDLWNSVSKLSLRLCDKICPGF